MGIPFSDPLADGPTIQKAVERSLAKKCTVKRVFALVKDVRKTIEQPLVFMTYYNIILNYGVKRFLQDAKKAGADGVIVPDLPLEESMEMSELAKREDFCSIMLTAPTTPAARFKKIAARSRGFIYHVSLTGVTGARRAVAARLKSDVRKFKKLTNKPLCVGFGISNPSQAKDIAGYSDGVIVGSAIIKIIEKNLTNKEKMVREISSFVGSVAKAVHGVRG